MGIGEEIDEILAHAPHSRLCDECFEKDAVWQCYECGVPRAQGKTPVTPVLFCDDHRDSKF